MRGVAVALVGVAAGLLVGVDPGGWCGPGEAGFHLQGPGAGVDVVVVSAADEGEVVEVGGAALGPVPQVVGVAPGCGGGAAGDDAGAVAGDQCAALGRGDGADGVAEVEDLAVAADQGGLDDGVAEEPGQPRRGEGSGLVAISESSVDSVRLEIALSQRIVNQRRSDRSYSSDRGLRSCSA